MLGAGDRLRRQHAFLKRTHPMPLRCRSGPTSIDSARPGAQLPALMATKDLATFSCRWLISRIALNMANELSPRPVALPSHDPR